jgi:hypothetical protein
LRIGQQTKYLSLLFFEELLTKYVAWKKKQEKMNVKRFVIVIPFILTLLASLVACTSTPANQDKKNILFADNFTNSSSGWTQLKNDTGTIGYTNNYYQISVNQPETLLLANPGKSFQGDVSIEVDARKISGSDDNYFGILCHYQNPDNYFMFMITSDGYSGIAMRKAGQDTLISPGLKFLKMVGINTGNKTNHIRADCIGEKLTLYANGKQVSLAYNKSLTGGDTGLAVRSGTIQGSVNIRFDNFTVSSPSQP